jgi:hypothetical protein
MFMKDIAPESPENGALEEVLLETIVSSHYLALQMRIVAAAAGFAGAAETELMAEALSRWAHLAGAKWIDGAVSGESGDDPAGKKKPRSVRR